MNLYHKIYGEGEVVVILHGLFGMSDNWKTIAKALASTYSVVTIDLPNHGRSPRLKTFDLYTIADALHEFLTQNWMYEIRLIGHSLGAKVAMIFAQQYPDMLRSLISVDMSPREYQAGHASIFAALQSINFTEHKNRMSIDEKLSEYISDINTRLFLGKNIKRDSNGFSWKFDLETLERDYSNILIPIPPEISIDIPTLFLNGKDSTYVTASDEHLIRSIFSKVHVVTIENAGHWVHADQPEALIKNITSFLSKQL